MTERMTLAQLRAAQKKESKGVQRVIGARRVHVPDFGWFDSHAELKRWNELLLLERSGEIHSLERQVPLELKGEKGPILTPSGKPMRYIADFRYFDTRINAVVIEDKKSGDHRTEVYSIKKAILAAMGTEILET